MAATRERPEKNCFGSSLLRLMDFHQPNKMRTPATLKLLEL
jgi:hypothetical protein